MFANRYSVCPRPNCIQNFCPRVEAISAPRSPQSAHPEAILYSHISQEVSVCRGLFAPRSPQAPSQKKMLFANHPHAPCIVLSDQFQHLLKAMLLKTTRNCGDLLLQLLHKGGVYPPWSQSELLLLGGVDPPQACDLLLLGGVYPPEACWGLLRQRFTWRPL